MTEWLQTLLADINNQSADADRLINRDCIFKWAQAPLRDAELADPWEQRGRGILPREIAGLPQTDEPAGVFLGGGPAVLGYD